MLSINSIASPLVGQSNPLTTSGSSGSIVWLKGASLVGGLSAVVMIVSGLATNLFGLVALGVVFTTTSLIGTYAAHQFRFLKDVDAYTAEITRLNESVRQKDAELVTLNQQMNHTAQELASAQQKYQKMLQDDQAAQEKLNQQLSTTEQRLQQTTKSFDQAQEDASAAMSKTIQDFGQKESDLKKEVDKETAQIVLLQQTIGNAKEEIDRLHGEAAALKQTLAQYTAQNQEYARQNEVLQQQIKGIGVQTSGQTLHQDIAKINSNSQKLEDLISQQNTQANNVIAVADQLKGILDRIQAVNQSVTSSVAKPQKEIV